MNKMNMIRERRRKVSRRIDISVAILIVIFNLLSITGCSKSNALKVNETSVDLTKVSVEWDSIKSNLKNAELSDLYYDASTIDEDIKDFNAITFANYDLTDLTAFKKVGYQLSITYGIAEKNDGSVFDEPVYEFIFVDNDSDKFYSVVCQTDKDMISSEGDWFLDDDGESIISTYINELNEAMGIQ